MNRRKFLGVLAAAPVAAVAAVKALNCENCGAIHNGVQCDYCGTKYMRLEPEPLLMPRESTISNLTSCSFVYDASLKGFG